VITRYPVAGVSASSGGAALAKDGALPPATVLLPRQSLRLAQYREANERPRIAGTNSPTPASGYVDLAITETIPEADVWGAVGWSHASQGLTNYLGADAPDELFAPPWEMEFVTDSPEFAIKMTTGGAPLMILVDEEIIYSRASSPSGGSWAQFVWAGGRQLRRYRLRGYLSVHSIRLAAVDSILAPGDDPGPRVAWIADSYGQQMGRNSHDGMARLATAALGWKRLMLDAQGSTGYAQKIGTGQTFLTRVPALVAAQPDLVVWAGGHNRASGEDLSVSAAAVFAAVRDELPDVPMWAVGPLSQSTTFENSISTVWTQLAAACAAYDVTFIDNRGWVTGTGHVGAEAGDGNADVLVGDDATHYNTYGTEYVAMRVAAAISATL
jgi:hypothetical protein